MNKLSLYFLDEELYIDFPKNLQNLKKQISSNFNLTDALINCINLCYNNSDSKILSIKSEEDFNSFLKKNICKYLKEREENGDANDLKRLQELILKDEEYTKLSPNKFKKEEDEIKQINKLMEELRTRKAEIENNIKKDKESFEKERKKIKEEIVELQIKMGLPTKYEK